MKRYVIFPFVLSLLGIVAGCTTAAVGGGAAGAYKIGTDERTAGQMWDDSAITAKIKKDLAADSVTDAIKIDVDTLEGEVTLNGVVENEQIASRAIELAKLVPGVKSVRNNLQIGSKTIGQSVDDGVLAARIKARLVAEPNIRSLNIDVDVNKGVTTLSGIVDSQTQKQRIVEIATDANGGNRIVDQIRVTQP